MLVYPVKTLYKPLTVVVIFFFFFLYLCDEIGQNKSTYMYRCVIHNIARALLNKLVSLVRLIMNAAMLLFLGEDTI
jgi:hypothetical protein